MWDKRFRDRSLALLHAASVLARQGRTASATALRQGLLSERLLHATRARHNQFPASADLPPLSSAVRVAALLDEFSANSFEGCFDAVHLLPDRWREQFAVHKPQIFFCESAWSGLDSKLRPWKGKIYASINFPRENRTALLEILSHCRANGIPTVFWNKEDPTHYPDRVHDFVRTATEFDHVFTTAAECVADYQRDHGLRSVHALSFATNPRLFNPIETEPRSDVVTFAGSWYANHAGRCADMHHILRGLQSGGHRLEIYDRYFHDDDPLHRWPEEYSPFILPPVPHKQVAEVYKRSRFALNINTVTGSRTMFARRVFELMSSNTLVLSNYSTGLEAMLGRDVIFCDREPGRLAALDDSEIESIRSRNLNLVLSRHTYRHRWEEILTAIGFVFRPAAEALTVVWPVRNGEDARAGVSWFQKEADLTRDSLLLLALDDMPPLEISGLYERFNRFGITVTSLRHAEDLAIEGRYGAVETDYIALILPEDQPPVGWLARARLHLQYAGDRGIGVARDGTTKYTLCGYSPAGSMIRPTKPDQNQNSKEAYRL